MSHGIKKNQEKSVFLPHFEKDLLLFLGLTLPARASGELSPSCSSLKSWPKVLGLEVPAAAELWLPPSASSTGTTVKLVGMLTPGEPWERVQRAALRRPVLTCELSTPTGKKGGP